MIVLNAFRLHDTHGVPLSIQVTVYREAGVPVSLPAFYRDALRAGCRAAKAAAIVEEVLVDAGQPRDYVDAALAYLATFDATSEVPGEEES